MTKRPSFDLSSLTAQAAEPMREAAQRMPEAPRQPVAEAPSPAPPPTSSASRKRGRPTTAAVPTADLVPLYFKVPPAFQKRFKRMALDAELKLVELLTEAIDHWERSKTAK